MYDKRAPHAGIHASDTSMPAFMLRIPEFDPVHTLFFVPSSLFRLVVYFHQHLGLTRTSIYYRQVDIFYPESMRAVCLADQDTSVRCLYITSKHLSRYYLS